MKWLLAMPAGDGGDGLTAVVLGGGPTGVAAAHALRPLFDQVIDSIWRDGVKMITCSHIPVLQPPTNI